MLSPSLRVARPLVLLLAASSPAVAQYVSTPPPGATPPPGPTDITVTPKNGQTPQQQWSDRYACHGWAVTQSGFDPSHKSAAAPAQGSEEEYRRSLTGCLEERGYTVHQAAVVPQPTDQMPAPHAAPIVVAAAAPPEAKYHPLSFRIDGGYTITTANTKQTLHNGGNLGLGFTLTPSPDSPFSLRVDGSYSWFNIRNDAPGYSNNGYSPGYSYIYGGDADLQFNLAHAAAGSRLYLLGGFGWYREQLHLRQVSIVNGIICDFYFCYPGQFPAVTSTSTTTSPWQKSWNAGIGWEASPADGGPSFFIEARYLRILPQNSKTAFIPIRLGLRF